MKAQFNHLLMTCHRRSRAISKISGLIGFLLALGVTPFLHAQCRYSWEIIRGPFCGSSGGPASFAGRTLDEDGNAAGFSLCFLSRTASSWPGSGDAQHLTGPPSVGNTFAIGMTDLDHIVGKAQPLGSEVTIAAFWEFGQGQLLGMLPGTNTSTANGINSSGQIVGLNFDNIFGPLHAVLWGNDQPTILNLPMGPNASATSINDLGQVTGWMGVSDVQDSHGYIWDDGVVLDIGVVPGGTAAIGLAINNLSHVVGRSRIPDGVSFLGLPHAWFWDGQTMIRLPELPDHTESHAQDINDADQIVGYSRGNSRDEAVLWQDGQVYRLEDLLEPPLLLGSSTADAINSNGQILLGRPSSLLLTPIDSPPGDVNNNCMVDVEDLLILLGDWGKTLSIADVFPDGIVNVEDLLVVLGDWGLGGQS